MMVDSFVVSGLPPPPQNEEIRTLLHVRKRGQARSCLAIVKMDLNSSFVIYLVKNASQYSRSLLKVE